MQDQQKSRYIYLLAFFGDLSLSLIGLSLVLFAVELGATTTQVGIISSAYGLTYLFMPALLGRLGDKIGRKMSLLIATIGQTGVALFLIWVAIADYITPNLGHLMLAHIFGGIVYGFFWPAIEAYVSETTEDGDGNHIRSISNFCVAWSLGFSLGPLIAGYFSEINVLFSFIVLAVIYAIEFLIVLIKIPKIPSETQVKQQEQKKANSTKNEEIQLKEISMSLDKANNSKHNVAFILLFGTLIYSMLGRFIFSYFANYAVLPEGLNWSGTLVGQMIFVVGMARTVFFFFGRYTKPEVSRIIIAFLPLGLLLFILMLVTSPILIILIFIAFGGLLGHQYFSSLELLLKNEREGKGAKAGIFESAVGFGSVLSPVIAGGLGEINLRLPFLGFGLFSIVLGGISYIYLKNGTNKK